MAAHPISSGHGSTLSFISSGFTGSIISIGGFEQTREALDKTHLGSGNYKEYIPGDIVEGGQFTVDMFYDANSQPPILGDAETIEIALPLANPLNVTPATISGTGFVIGWSTPEIGTDTLLRSQVTVKWSQFPSFSPESA